MSANQHMRDERLDVRWRAHTIINEKRHACLVDNVSTAGARLELDIALKMGDELLVEIADMGEFAGEVVWLNQPFYGLKLMAGPDLDLKSHADEIGLKA